MSGKKAVGGGPPYGAERIDRALALGWRRLAGGARSALRALPSLLARLRPGRRIRPTTAGTLYLLGVLAIGLAAINTGNNLLYLLLGALLGTVAVSGWLSERMLRDLEVRRLVPRGVAPGPSVRIRYEVRNGKRRLPSLDVRVRERGVPGEEGAYLLRIEPGETTVLRSAGTELTRGVYPLERVTLSTTFPFGLVRKERDLRRPDELLVRPRSDRRVPIPPAGSAAGMRRGALGGRTPLGHRGEYRGLREYRAGDDLRDVHWRKSASGPATVVREYEPEAGREVRIHLDTAHPPGGAAEAAAEIAASLAARATSEGRVFTLHTSAGTSAGGTGPAALDQALDLLARVEFDPAGPAHRPENPGAWILVTPTGRGRGPFGAVLRGASA